MTSKPAITVATAALACLGTGAVLVQGGGARPVTVAASVGLTAQGTGLDALRPGTSTTGELVVENVGAAPEQLGEVTFAPASSDECAKTGVSLAATLPPTPEAPLEVPAHGTATLGWTAYMDGEGDDSCQGAPLTSVVTVDGEQAGTVVLTAARLDVPPAPTGGLTTSTRAAVRWSPSTASAPGWVVERAVAGTKDWEAACGSSAQRPVRALSCTDTGLSASTAYVYRVTLRTGHWQATSLAGRPVTTQARPSA